jgi:hypothetical protein
LARRQILARTEATLAKAGVIGILPTPLDAVAEAAQIAEVIDISQLPEDLAKLKPPAMRRILGALLHRERVAFIDFTQKRPRARLTHAHEIGHKIIPWHALPLQLDDAERLLGITHDQLEIEAYFAGGHLIFQGSRFHQQALDYKVSIETPLALAEEYGASLHATIRYYVANHPDPVGLLIAGVYQKRDGTVPLWRSVESPAFFRRFGCLADHLSDGLAIAGGQGKPLGDIVYRALRASEVAAKLVGIADLGGERHDFVAEAFSNTRNVLVMVSEPKARRRFARGIRVAAS